VKRSISIAISATLALVLAGLAIDYNLPSHASLRDFDPHTVARLETDMWRSYYDHRRLHLFTQLADLLRTQYHFPVARSWAGAFLAARAAAVFQPGHNRAEYEQALTDLHRYYPHDPRLE
jgi:hypothetical protein